MTRDQALALRARVQHALPDCVVLIFDRGLGIGYVVTVEDAESAAWVSDAGDLARALTDPAPEGEDG